MRALVLTCSMLTLAACGSGTHLSDQGINPPTSGNPGGGTTPPGGLPNTPSPPVPVTQVTLTGKLTFDLVPFSATAGAGLDYATTIQSPARAITLEVVNQSTNAVIATATTDATGTYSIPSVPANLTVFIRAKAQMGNIQVLDNTSGDALYQYEGPQFSTGAIEPRERNENIPSGWGGTDYTLPRNAAPFAILNAVYDAQQFVRASVPGASFPSLNLYWSALNKANTVDDDFDVSRVTGDIDDTQYIVEDTAHPGIYLVGDKNNDTDEYDADIVIEQWAYYYLASFSRDDSVGGSFEDRLDLRNAYSEGWAFALPLMVKSNPVFRDSSGAAQGANSVDDVTAAVADPGWFSPRSIASVIYDLWDADNTGIDSLTLPFATLHATLAEDMPATDAFTSIYPFANALAAREPGSIAQIGALLNAQQIVLPTDDFGSTETNNAGDALNTLPLYRTLVAGAAAIPIHSIGDQNYYYNAPENRRFFRFNVLSTRATTQIRAQGPVNSDPDIIVWKNGERVAGSHANEGETDSTATGLQVFDVNNLTVGTYIIEVYDSFNIFPDDPATDTSDTTINVRIP